MITESLLQIQFYMGLKQAQSAYAKARTTGWVLNCGTRLQMAK